MENAEYLNDACFNQIVGAVGKASEQHAPRVVVLDSVGFRINGRALDGSIQLKEKFDAETWPLAFVPLDSFSDVGDGLGSNLDVIQWD